MLARDKERKIEPESGHEGVHQKAAEVEREHLANPEDLQHRCRFHGPRRDRWKIAGEHHDSSETEQAGQPEERFGAEASGNDGTGNHPENERHSDRNPENRHGGRTALRRNLVGDRRKGGGGNRADALDESAENQLADLESGRKPMRHGGEERSQAEDRHAEQQDFAPPDAVGKPSERKLGHGHGQAVTSESKAHQESRLRELQAVESEDG